MSLLLYGILFAEPCGGQHGPAAADVGVAGARVSFIETGGLAAAVSRLDEADLAPSVERALTFARVVETLHHTRTILPMRYGCVLRGEPSVVALLREQGSTLTKRLRSLDGCVEMGVRILVSAAPPARHPVAAPCGPLPGTAYLTQRRTVYLAEEACAREAAASADRLRAALEGLFLGYKADAPADRTRLLPRVPFPALYFLVRRDGLAAFQSAFRRIEPAERARLRLSGPWPPYNFATLPATNE